MPVDGRNSQPTKELRLLGLELGVGEHAPLAQLVELAYLVGDRLASTGPLARQVLVRERLADAIELAILVRFHLVVDLALDIERPTNVGEARGPLLACRFDDEIPGADDPLEDRLAEEDGVDALEGDFGPRPGKDAVAADEAIGGQHEVGGRPGEEPPAEPQHREQDQQADHQVEGLRGIKREYENPEGDRQHKRHGLAGEEPPMGPKIQHGSFVVAERFLGHDVTITHRPGGAGERDRHAVRSSAASPRTSKVDGVDADGLLDGLNERQVMAVTHSGGPLVVLAGAGSGKTRVLTRRIAYRIAIHETDPRRVLALTFTRKAASELRSRLRHLGLRDDVVAGTFHGVALTQLRQRWADRGVAPPAVLDRKYRFVSQLMGRRQGVEALDVVSEIEWARARLVTPEQYPAAAELAGRTSPIPAAELAELMHRFAQEKRQRRVVDFDDLLALATRDLQIDPEYAAAVRWRHRHLYVDEFQDVNPLQYELLKAWRGDSADLFVVGDPHQAIYGWNGADPNLLRSFTRREPAATIVELSDNYRSTPQILTAAVAALGGRAGHLTAHLPDGPVPTLTAYASDRAEAQGIAETILRIKTIDRPWADQAVLVRTNAQLVPIEQALVNAGVPVRVRGGSGPLATQEVKSELRSLGRPGTDLTLAVRALDESIGIGGGLLAQVDDLRRSRGEPLFNDSEAPPELTPAEIERQQNLAALSRLVHEYLSVDPDPTGPGLVAWVTTISAGEVQIDADAVELATFHGAKGLEWAVVHLAGLEQGFVPISYAKTAEQIAEEQRLLYVGITRAGHELHLSWAAERTFGTRAAKRQPSPHLDQLQSAIEHLRRGHRPVDWRAEVARSRGALPTGPKSSRAGGAVGAAGHAQPEDPAFEALRTWRRNRARAADVPAFVVFTDQTLRALAERRPTNRSQLASTPGIGPAKLERYGDEVLEILRQTDP